MADKFNYYPRALPGKSLQYFDKNSLSKDTPISQVNSEDIVERLYDAGTPIGKIISPKKKSLKCKGLTLKIDPEYEPLLEQSELEKSLFYAAEIFFKKQHLPVLLKDGNVVNLFEVLEVGEKLSWYNLHNAAKNTIVDPTLRTNNQQIDFSMLSTGMSVTFSGSRSEYEVPSVEKENKETSEVQDCLPDSAVNW